MKPHGVSAEKWRSNMQLKYLSGYFNYKKGLTDYYLYLDHPKKEEIDMRIKIMKFFKKYGSKATKTAFGVSRSTVYLWQKKLKDSGGNLLSLAPESKAPKKKRQKLINDKRLKFILEYRKKHPKVNQYVIKAVLDKYCNKEGLEKISESTIARRIKYLKEKKWLRDDIQLSFNGKSGNVLERKKRKKKKKKRIGKYKPNLPGDLVQIDTIVRYYNGIKRYIITAIDIKTRIAFAYTYTNKSSKSAKDFLIKLRAVMPFEIKRIQTDNGSEFMKYFDSYIVQNELIHYFNYPRTPKMNAYIERFNGVIQLQFVDYTAFNMEDLAYFNNLLMDYLLWYNSEKVHLSLDKKTPLDYYIDNFVLSNILTFEKSNMLRHRTGTCIFRSKVV